MSAEHVDRLVQVALAALAGYSRNAGLRQAAAEAIVAELIERRDAHGADYLNKVLDGRWGTAEPSRIGQQPSLEVRMYVVGAVEFKRGIGVLAARAGDAKHRELDYAVGDVARAMLDEEAAG